MTHLPSLYAALETYRRMTPDQQAAVAVVLAPVMDAILDFCRSIGANVLPTTVAAAPDPSDILTAGEAMRLLGMSRTTFYRLCREGELPMVRPATGRKMYFSRDALGRWQQECQGRGQWRIGYRL